MHRKRHPELRNAFSTTHSTTQISRRDIVQRSAAAGVAAASAGMWMPADGLAKPSRSLFKLIEDKEGVFGGTLRVGIVGEPPTLDEQQTTARLVADITYPMYETLFVYDANYQPVPHLVETYSSSEDQLTHTFTLRKGITFHNDEPMTAADVIASITRWGELSGVGQRLIEKLDNLVEIDEITIELHLSETFGPLLTAFANNTQGCTIHPRSILDEIGIAPFEVDNQIIGTGPYQLTERKADAYIRLTRFEDYKSRDESIDGYSGMRNAYVDQIEFIPVPNEASRVAGLRAGDYHIITDISNDQYDSLSKEPNIVAQIQPPYKFEAFFLNWRSPLTGNLAIRQAFQSALNHDVILMASHGAEDFYVLDPGWMMQPSHWHTTAGEENYNVNDPDLARQKLEEAGYDGTPLRFLTSEERLSYYNASIVARQQLEDVGFTVEMITVDWATLLDLRGRDDEWDVFVTGHGFVPDPSQLTLVGQMGLYPGWWDSEESLALARDLIKETEFDDRYAIWEEIQERIYSEIPAVKIGDVSLASYYADAIGGWVNTIARGIPYWNLWLNDE